MVANPWARMNKFVLEVSDLVNEKCRTTMLIGDTDISRLMTYAEHLEGEKLRKGRVESPKGLIMKVGFKELGVVEMIGSNKATYFNAKGHQMLKI